MLALGYMGLMVRAGWRRRGGGSYLTVEPLTLLLSNLPETRNVLMKGFFPRHLIIYCSRSGPMSPLGKRGHS